ncbi:putative quorum-sensing-regulated virulence factor [Acinetobacter sp. Leaf130]|uniref:putative quorum-sensing-regulated virulence factor n=1 Tax=Acinetobacter sp. Leaf130 TaxID=1736269 RepID=UPI0006F5AB5B|nr:DUF3820 family protein [Acinetobacter sp. Leaf130]KQQ77271.1 DNA polymerase III subunit epsilon [Acinetobacter sp. Leaf130]
MEAIILDTETHTLHGYPIEIAHAPCSFVDGKLVVNKAEVFDEYFSCPEPIAYGAMAIHHILESDIADKPSYETFRAPECEFIIGHNIDYDIQAIRLAHKDFNAKAICTLALSRMVWPEEAHNISALVYMLTKGSEKARQSIRNAHNTKQDVFLTGFVLTHICKNLGLKDMQSLYLASEHARVPTVMPFGKYKGAKIKDLPADYVAWLLRQDDIDKYVLKALQG